MSPHTADVLSYWANWALLGALAVGVVATALIWRTGLVKDAEFSRYRLEAEARVADARKAGLDAGQKASEATLAAAEADKRAAEANVRAEELRTSNLNLERDLVELRKSVRGREISDAQHKIILEGAKGLKLPNITVYVNDKDPEAKFYAFSIVSVLQDIGIAGNIGLLPENPPQIGATFFGTGTADEGRFQELLIKAKIITLAYNGGPGFPDVSPERSLGGPPGSIIVGIRSPGSMIRGTQIGNKRKHP